MRLSYNAQLNIKPRIFKIYTPWEFYLGMVAGFTPVLVQLVFAVDPNFLDAVIVFVVYTLCLIYFKIGKPEGYFEHLMKHLVTPIRFRPGHKCGTYPLRPETNEALHKALQRTPEQLWDAAAENQRFITRNRLVRERLTSTRYVALTQEEADAVMAYIDGGGLVCVGDKETFMEKIQTKKNDD